MESPSDPSQKAAEPEESERTAPSHQVLDGLQNNDESTAWKKVKLFGR